MAFNIKDFKVRYKQLMSEVEHELTNLTIAGYDERDSNGKIVRKLAPELKRERDEALASLTWALALITDWVPTNQFTIKSYDKAQKLVGGLPFSKCFPSK